MNYSFPDPSTCVRLGSGNETRIRPAYRFAQERMMTSCTLGLLNEISDQLRSCRITITLPVTPRVLRQLLLLGRKLK